MYGAIIGDIAGSKYEFNSIKTKDFPFISPGCRFTDDTVMTVAVARALLMGLEEGTPFKPALIWQMQTLGRRFPGAGYGGRFRRWLREEHPRPYRSYGNGSAMRASPCGLLAVTLQEAVDLARVSALVTHDHPEGIKGAEAAAAAVFLAKTGSSREAIRDHIHRHYYPLTQTLDETHRRPLPAPSPGPITAAPTGGCAQDSSGTGGSTSCSRKISPIPSPGSRPPGHSGPRPMPAPAPAGRSRWSNALRAGPRRIMCRQNT